MLLRQPLFFIIFDKIIFIIMKKLLLLILIFSGCYAFSQDTFSIVAVDTVTGEIGSAGASCIDESQIEGGALIISDVMAGRGAIHTQSYWNATNQQNAHNRMVEGMSPQEIIDWLTTHDAQGNPAVRQYGVVDFDEEGHARAAAFTGNNCMNYKNHIVGPNYAIQGNILLGQQILDSIEARFLNTQGSFAERMMSALQGANVVGADTRCTNNGTSSLSAFIRIARPQDTTGTFYCDLNVPSVPDGMEPIDSLQVIFDEWLETAVGIDENADQDGFVIYPNPAGTWFSVGQHVLSPAKPGEGSHLDNSAPGLTSSKDHRIFIQNMLGERIREIEIQGNLDGIRIDVSECPNGLYFVSIYSDSVLKTSNKLIILR